MNYPFQKEPRGAGSSGNFSNFIKEKKKEENTINSIRQTGRFCESFGFRQTGRFCESFGFDEVKKTPEKNQHIQRQTGRFYESFGFDEVKKTPEKNQHIQDEVKKTPAKIQHTEDEVKKTPAKIQHTEDEVEKKKKELLLLILLVGKKHPVRPISSSDSDDELSMSYKIQMEPLRLPQLRLPQVISNVTIPKRISPNFSSTETNIQDYNIVLLGDSKVGKTSLINKFFGRTFSDQYVATTKVITHKLNRQSFTLQIIDTPIANRFSRFYNKIIEIGNAFALVYSVTSEQSFNSLANIYEYIKLSKSNIKKVPIMLTGNKIDLAEDRKVSSEDGKKQATNWMCEFLETSAKDNINVDALFEYLLTMDSKQPSTSFLDDHCRLT